MHELEKSSNLQNKMSSTSSTPAVLLINVFEGLAGSWVLNRQLRSADSSEPSGRCAGTATFTKIQAPSPVLDEHGKLDIADAELLYHEHGEFEMVKATGDNLTSVSTFAFSRRYIWRFQKANNAYTISVWFTKPGTEVIDYLFHKIDIPTEQEQTLNSNGRLVLNGSGGHLCVEDFYSSYYAFTLSRPDDESSLGLVSWTTVHEVLGPKKEQHIETTFVRPWWHALTQVPMISTLNT